jgi:PTS system mannose-specific IID component
VNEDRNHIGFPDLLVLFSRLLLIQASWSFDRMQTAGFAYAIEPAIRKLYPDAGEYERRMKLHLEYFNTQPYFASFILGAAVRLEQDRAAGTNGDPDIAGLKASLMAPLGALGDSFFWGALRPAAAVAAAAVLITGYWWAPILFFVLFNIWHVGLRLAMLFWGFAGGGDALALMARYGFTKMARRFKIVSLTLVGGMLAVMPFWRPDFRIAAAPAPAVSLAGLSATLVIIAVMRRGGSPVQFMLGLAALCLALAFAGVV